MSNIYHTVPLGEKTGIQVAGKWLWQKADWEKCDCGFYHSNRIIPKDFWNKWNLSYSKTDKPCVKRSNGIILVRGNKEVWVTQSYGNYFGFPKGSESTYMEDPLIGALREFDEETGLDSNTVFAQKDLTKGGQIRWFDFSKKIEYNFFIVEVPLWFQINTYPKDDIEITSFGWVNINKLKNIKFSKAMKEIYTQFMELRSYDSYEDFIEKRIIRLNDTWERHHGHPKINNRTLKHKKYNSV